MLTHLAELQLRLLLYNGNSRKAVAIDTADTVAFDRFLFHNSHLYDRVLSKLSLYNYKQPNYTIFYQLCKVVTNL